MSRPPPSLPLSPHILLALPSRYENPTTSHPLTAHHPGLGFHRFSPPNWSLLPPSTHGVSFQPKVEVTLLIKTLEWLFVFSE